MKMWRGRKALGQLEGVRKGVLWEVKISGELDRHTLESEVAFSRGNRMCKTRSIRSRDILGNGKCLCLRDEE